MKISRSKSTDEWGTPKWLFSTLHNEFDFQLDVCASAINHKIPHYLDIQTDGLVSGWDQRNWCNPPYSDQLPWMHKSMEEMSEHDALTVMLIKYDPSTKHGRFVREFADEIRIIEHRLKFQGATQTATFPTSIAIFRPRFFTRKSEAKVFYVDYREIQS